MEGCSCGGGWWCIRRWSVGVDVVVVEGSGSESWVCEHGRLMPTFLTLSEWGGTPNGWPSMTLPATALWVHHSVTVRTGAPAADFRTLDAIGLSRGHGGISYSYAIEGSVIGEGQGLRRGAHTAGDGCGGSPWGWNPCSFGVVFVGNFDDDTLTAEDIASFQWLRDRLIADGHLVPGVYPTGGHRDAPGNSTGCPGTNIEAALDLLRGVPTPPPSGALPPLEDTMLILRNSDAPVGDTSDFLVIVGKKGYPLSLATSNDLHSQGIPRTPVPGPVVLDWAAPA
jgi:hypothetical protein